MQVRSTISGAKIIQLDTKHVLKLGDGAVGDRIGDQAEWLTKNASPGIVQVERITRHAYSMPLLLEWDQPIDTRAHFECLEELLSRAVWRRPPVHLGDQHDPFGTKVSNMDPLFRVMLEGLSHRVQWDRVHRCLTHGDPTFCNTMQAYDESMVLLDPLPSSEMVPDVRAKDLGKMLQSLMRYEEHVLGWEYDDEPDPYWVRDICKDGNEWNAAKFCGVLHIARLLPYVVKTTQEKRYFYDVATAICDL